MPNEPTNENELELDLDESPTRRKFIFTGLCTVGAGYAAAIGYPIYAYLSTPAKRAAEASAVTQVSLENGEDKLPPGAAKPFKFGLQGAILIHHSDGSWIAMGTVCTHLGCTVKYEPENSRMFCACHGGVYDSKTGANVAGPPPKPLPIYRVEVQDGRVIVSKS